MTGNRRAFLAALTLPMIAARASAAELTRLRVGAIAITDCAPFFAALQQGSFASNGLDVVTESETGGALGIPAVVAGAYDIVYTNLPSALLAIQQGIDLRFIAGGSPLNPPDTTGLLIRHGDAMRTGKDFEGKVIGINDTRGLQWMYARGWIKATGGDQDKVTYRAVSFPQMSDAVKNKYVDGIIPSEPFLSLNRSDPTLDLIASPGRTVFPKGRVAAWVVSGDFATRHADLVRKFVVAMDKGSQWVNANLNTPAFAQFIAGYTKLDVARVATLAKGPTSVGISASDVRRMADLMRANGLLTTAIDPVTKIAVPR
ncbi:MAG TPA: ABC transporter substrate-binding protein [Candidatus Binatia bacterium]|nr:ABC transporter substrate-binding protein [Candidatus Binatia bacterium]